MDGKKRGGQPGNQNAVTHGRFSEPARFARLAAAAEREEKHRRWMKTIPKTDYAAICAEMAPSRAALPHRRTLKLTPRIVIEAQAAP
jgi:hypothetical protein